MSLILVLQHLRVPPQDQDPHSLLRQQHRAHLSSCQLAVLRLPSVSCGVTVWWVALGADLIKLNWRSCKGAS